MKVFFKPLFKEPFKNLSIEVVGRGLPKLNLEAKSSDIFM
jgi:hypothetical protein